MIAEGRYYNANGYATAIAAKITEDVDWAAYIGGCDLYMDEFMAYDFVAKTGTKLPESDARHYFPDIKLKYRP
jgi:hypothetical protein